MKKSKKLASQNGAHGPLGPLLRDPDLQPQEVILSHNIVAVLRTIHHSSYQVSPSIEGITGANHKKDPLRSQFYDAESQVVLIVDEREVAAFNLQSSADLVDLEHRRTKHYIESHLAEVIERAVVKLCNEARDRGTVSRTELVARGVREEETAIRRRLPLERKPRTSWKWIGTAVQTLQEMNSQNVPLTKTNFAKRLFPRSSNALQDLQRKLRHAPYPMDFNELLLFANLHRDQIANPGIMVVPPIFEPRPPSIK